jgi:very-short-patch-repair endonuclease
MGPESFDKRIAALAAVQHGVFTRAQARECGGTKAVIRTRLDRLQWEEPYAGVFRLAGVPRTFRQSLLAAQLAWGPESVVSHRAGAALVRLASFRRAPIELTVPRKCRRPYAEHIVHRPRRALSPLDVTRVEGIPVTTPARTLIDLAAVADARSVEIALHDALRRGLVSPSRLRWRTEEAAGSGRGGVALIRELLEACRGPGVPMSVFETVFSQGLRASDLPEATRQHQVKDGGRLIATIDFAFPDYLIAIETDGYDWHSDRPSWQRDRARRNRLTLLGWRIIHITWADLQERPDEVFAELRKLIEATPAR